MRGVHAFTDPAGQRSVRRPLGRAPGRTRDLPGRAGALAAILALAAGTASCDDQVKYVDTFSTMTEQRAEQTYEMQPRPPVEGTVPVSGLPETYTLAEADTALTSPLRPAASVVDSGRVVYQNFCVPCHGAEGRGRGPVINHTGEHPNRLPPLPTADLTSERARGLSDGYIWGMIANGRGMMPAYRRVPSAARWYAVEYVRHLQEAASSDTAAGTDVASRSSAGASPGGEP